MKNTSGQRLHIFIDGPYLRLLQRRLDWNVSYRALLEFLVSDRNLIAAHYYFGFARDSHSKLLSLLQACKYNVHCVKLSEAEATSVMHEQRRGGVLVPMVIDIVEMSTSASTDVVLLCSSNRELAPLLRKLKDRKITVELAGVPQEIPTEFHQHYSRLVDLSQYRGELEHKDEYLEKP